MDNFREDILLKERVSQVDDINLDMLLSQEEVEEKEIEKFDEPLPYVSKIELEEKEESLSSAPAFEMEVMPNEFLDNIAFRDEEKNVAKKSKIKIQNKPLFVTLTSIIALLGILFIYNLFMLGSLESKALSLGVPIANIESTENSYIQFENGSTMDINFYSINTNDISAQTNWFNSLVDGLNGKFGG